MADEKKYKFVCVVCGYEVEVDTPELPEVLRLPRLRRGPISSSSSRSSAHASRRSPCPSRHAAGAFFMPAPASPLRRARTRLAPPAASRARPHLSPSRPPAAAVTLAPAPCPAALLPSGCGEVSDT